MDNQSDRTRRADPVEDAPAGPSHSGETPSGAGVDAVSPGRPVYRFFGREIPKPASRPVRIALGIVLTVLGIFGFLPILGFWMIPLGLLVLSHELHPLRRLRRRLAVRRARKAGNGRNRR